MATGGCCKWWRQRSNLEKTLIFLSIILFLTSIIVIVVGTFSSTSEVEDQLCTTKLCTETAADVMSKANFEIDPCDDFYEFACGQYVKFRSSPFDYHEASVEHDASDAVLYQLKGWLESENEDDDSVNKKARMLYSTCMAYDQPKDPIAIVRKVFEDEKIGSWPILNDTWDMPEFRLEQVFASMMLAGIPVTAKMQIIPDPDQKDAYITKLSPGEDLFRDEYVLRSDATSRYIESVLELLGVPRARTASKADYVTSTEARIFSLKRNAERECGKSTIFEEELGLKKLKSFQDIEEEFPYSNVNMEDVMTLVYKSLNTELYVDFPLDLYCKRYIREMSDFFYNDSPTSIHSYLGWRFLSPFIQYLGPQFRRLYSDYQYRISADQIAPQLHLPKWKECLSLVEQHMLPVLANAYRDAAITDAILKEKRDIAAAVKASYTKMFSSANWLKHEEKHHLKQKIADSRFESLLARLPLELERLDKWFENLQLQEDDNMLNVIRVKKFEVLNELLKLTETLDENLEWDERTLITDSNQWYTNRHITIPFDKIRIPYLNVLHQSHLNYGGLGVFLARQLYRYVDNSGANSSSISSIFIRSSSDNLNCLLENPDDYSFTQEEVKRNWLEAIMELSAVNAAFMSYNEQKDKDNILPGLEYTGDQMFFLAYAQTMCESHETWKRPTMNYSRISSKQKVNFVMKNLKQFTAAYSCGQGTPLKFGTKCHLWE